MNGRRLAERLLVGIALAWYILGFLSLCTILGPLTDVSRIGWPFAITWVVGGLATWLVVPSLLFRLAKKIGPR